MNEDSEFILNVVLMLAVVSAILIGVFQYEDRNMERCKQHNLTYSCTGQDECGTMTMLRCINYTESGVRQEIWVRR